MKRDGKQEKKPKVPALSPIITSDDADLQKLALSFYNADPKHLDSVKSLLEGQLAGDMPPIQLKTEENSITLITNDDEEEGENKNESTSTVDALLQCMALGIAEEWKESDRRRTREFCNMLSQKYDENRDILDVLQSEDALAAEWATVNQILDINGEIREWVVRFLNRNGMRGDRLQAKEEKQEEKIKKEPTSSSDASSSAAPAQSKDKKTSYSWVQEEFGDEEPSIEEMQQPQNLLLSEQPSVYTGNDIPSPIDLASSSSSSTSTASSAVLETTANSSAFNSTTTTTTTTTNTTATTTTTTNIDAQQLTSNLAQDIRDTRAKQPKKEDLEEALEKQQAKKEEKATVKAKKQEKVPVSEQSSSWFGGLFSSPKEKTPSISELIDIIEDKNAQKEYRLEALQNLTEKFEKADSELVTSIGKIFEMKRKIKVSGQKYRPLYWLLRNLRNAVEEEQEGFFNTKKEKTSIFCEILLQTIDGRSVYEKLISSSPKYEKELDIITVILLYGAKIEEGVEKGTIVLMKPGPVQEMLVAKMIERNHFEGVIKLGVQGSENINIWLDALNSKTAAEKKIKGFEQLQRILKGEQDKNRGKKDDGGGTITSTLLSLFSGPAGDAKQQQKKQQTQSSSSSSKIVPTTGSSVQSNDSSNSTATAQNAGKQVGNFAGGAVIGFAAPFVNLVKDSGEALLASDTVQQATTSIKAGVQKTAESVTSGADTIAQGAKWFMGGTSTTDKEAIEAYLKMLATYRVPLGNNFPGMDLLPIYTTLMPQKTAKTKKDDQPTVMADFSTVQYFLEPFAKGNVNALLQTYGNGITILHHLAYMDRNAAWSALPRVKPKCSTVDGEFKCALYKSSGDGSTVFQAALNIIRERIAFEQNSKKFFGQQFGKSATRENFVKLFFQQDEDGQTVLGRLIVQNRFNEAIDWLNLYKDCFFELRKSQTLGIVYINYLLNMPQNAREAGYTQLCHKLLELTVISPAPYVENIRQQFQDVEERRAEQRTGNFSYPSYFTPSSTEYHLTNYEGEGFVTIDADTSVVGILQALADGKITIMDAFHIALQQRVIAKNNNDTERGEQLYYFLKALVKQWTLLYGAVLSNEGYYNYNILTLAVDYNDAEFLDHLLYIDKLYSKNVLENLRPDEEWSYLFKRTSNDLYSAMHHAVHNRHLNAGDITEIVSRYDIAYRHQSNVTIKVGSKKVGGQSYKILLGSVSGLACVDVLKEPLLFKRADFAEGIIVPPTKPKQSSQVKKGAAKEQEKAKPLQQLPIGGSYPVKKEMTVVEHEAYIRSLLDAQVSEYLTLIDDIQSTATTTKIATTVAGAVGRSYSRVAVSYSDPKSTQYKVAKFELLTKSGALLYAAENGLSGLVAEWMQLYSELHELDSKAFKSNPIGHSYAYWDLNKAGREQQAESLKKGIISAFASKGQINYLPLIAKLSGGFSPLDVLKYGFPYVEKSKTLQQEFMQFVFRYGKWNSAAYKGAMIFAAEQNNALIIKTALDSMQQNGVDLLSAKAELNKDGENLLHLAARYGADNVVEFIFQAAREFEKKGVVQQAADNAINAMAGYSAQSNTTDFLISKNKNDENPFHVAAKFNKETVFSKLLNEIKDTDEQKKDANLRKQILRAKSKEGGAIPLHWAVHKNSPSMVDSILLVEDGTEDYANYKTGILPDNGKLAASASTTEADTKEYTPLGLASAYGYSNIVNTILGHTKYKICPDDDVIDNILDKAGMVNNSRVIAVHTIRKITDPARLKQLNEKVHVKLKALMTEVKNEDGEDVPNDLKADDIKNLLLIWRAIDKMQTPWYKAYGRELCFAAFTIVAASTLYHVMQNHIMPDLLKLNIVGLDQPALLGMGYGFTAILGVVFQVLKRKRKPIGSAISETFGGGATDDGKTYRSVDWEDITAGLFYGTFGFAFAHGGTALIEWCINHYTIPVHDELLNVTTHTAFANHELFQTISPELFKGGITIPAALIVSAMVIVPLIAFLGERVRWSEGMPPI
ncbi:MAG: hypothetical protein JSS50_00650 [Proteobacteria bacterium]|nr:hypothetical protein [Pseudomonadota bacterium]